MVESVIQDILSNLDSYEIDQIKEKLNPSLVGMSVQTPIIPPGEIFYRARRLTPEFTKSKAQLVEQLSYPRTEIPFGRANRPDHKIFYCSNFRDVVFYEIQDLQAGDEFILGYWRTSQKLLVNNIGYTNFVFESMGASRPLPQWTSKTNASGEFSLPDEGQLHQAHEDIKEHDNNRELREHLSKAFTSKSGGNAYKLTVAIAELHLGKISNHSDQFGGIIYPSVQMNASGDNLALLPWYVDDHLNFKKAIHFRIDAKKDKGFSFKMLDWADAENGVLNWRGHAPQWQLHNQGETLQFVFEAGPDEDGNYILSAEGNMGHWVARNANGEIVEPT